MQLDFDVRLLCSTTILVEKPIGRYAKGIKLKLQAAKSAETTDLQTPTEHWQVSPPL